MPEAGYGQKSAPGEVQPTVRSSDYAANDSASARRARRTNPNRGPTSRTAPSRAPPHQRIGRFVRAVRQGVAGLTDANAAEMPTDRGGQAARASARGRVRTATIRDRHGLPGAESCRPRPQPGTRERRPRESRRVSRVSRGQSGAEWLSGLGAECGVGRTLPTEALLTCYLPLCLPHAHGVSLRELDLPPQGR